MVVEIGEDTMEEFGNMLEAWANERDFGVGEMYVLTELWGGAVREAAARAARSEDITMQ